MNSNFSYLATDCEPCVKNNCDLNCDSNSCMYCSTCIDERKFKVLSQSYLEHIRRGEMLRIFPSSDYSGEEFFGRLSPANKFMVKWYEEKCELDNEWC